MNNNSDTWIVTNFCQITNSIVDTLSGYTSHHFDLDITGIVHSKYVWSNLDKSILNDMLHTLDIPHQSGILVKDLLVLFVVELLILYPNKIK